MFQLVKVIFAIQFHYLKHFLLDSEYTVIHFFQMKYIKHF